MLRRVPSSRRRGFTLVEVTIVVLIMGILAASTVPKYAGLLFGHRADSAAKRIEADLAWARQHAIASSTTVTVQFTPGAETYTITGVADLDHASRTYVVNLSEYPYHVDLQSTGFTGDDVQFNMHGLPDSGGVITVGSHSATQTVTLNAASGEASVP